MSSSLLKIAEVTVATGISRIFGGRITKPAAPASRRSQTRSPPPPLTSSVSSSPSGPSSPRQPLTRPRNGRRSRSPPRASPPVQWRNRSPARMSPRNTRAIQPGSAASSHPERRSGDARTPVPGPKILKTLFVKQEDGEDVPGGNRRLRSIQDHNGDLPVDGTDRRDHLQPRRSIQDHNSESRVEPFAGSGDYDPSKPLPSVEDDHDNLIIDNDNYVMVDDLDPAKTWPSIEDVDGNSISQDVAGEGQINDDDSYHKLLTILFPQEYGVDPAEDLKYREAKLEIKGALTWPREAARLHKLLWFRGMYPLMPSAWAYDLIDHPSLDGLFAPLVAEDPNIGLKPVLDNESSQFRATRALRNLFELHVRVSALRQAGLHDQTAEVIRKEMKSYMRWAKDDAKAGKEYDYVDPFFLIKIDVSADEEDYRDRGKSLADRLHVAFYKKALKYRNAHKNRGIENYPPIIYGFVVVQHMVMVMVMDTQEQRKSKRRPIMFAELDMSRISHWLDSALGIAIPINIARESLSLHRGVFPKKEEEEVDDPDI